ncbi:hypothetical protein AC626_21840 [Pseudoalteromonas rubra]|uniref:Uncharacterized protein n=1 Tax=Pseudoalteromonas rubra TaxID=43658 RepID=A0A0L0EME8_9GAMM|nr:hypothetical protein AC626_21840 [Pseudoalteromonas rubra]
MPLKKLRSRDNLLSDYVVHRLPAKSKRKISKEVNHVTQLTPITSAARFQKSVTNWAAVTT